MIVAVIPTRYHPLALSELLTQLHEEGVEVVLLESDDYGHAIYRMWNEGVRQGRSLGATEIAVLNDDVGIERGTLGLMAMALRSEDRVGVVYPDVRVTHGGLPPGIRLQDTTGTWGAGGMTGFCFMFRADEPSMPDFDEAYHWWYGDDAWEHEVRVRGWRVCRVDGLPVRHTPDGSASRDWSRLSPLIEQDRARFEAVG